MTQKRGMIELNGVAKSYGVTFALQKLSLAIPAGQTTLLIGTRGCGESTLLRLMIGLIVPDEGSIDVDGLKLTRENLLPLRRTLGYVLQDGGLFPHLSARDNVILMARYLRWDLGRITARLLELAELTHFPV